MFLYPKCIRKNKGNVGIRNFVIFLNTRKFFYHVCRATLSYIENKRKWKVRPFEALNMSNTDE
jgi:altronate dehydratase